MSGSTPTFNPAVTFPATVSNVAWGYPGNQVEALWLVQGDNVFRSRYVVHQGSPNGISVIGIKNSYAAISPSNYSSSPATWQAKGWDAEISGGSWQNVGELISLQMNGDCLTQDAATQETIYKPISGKYGVPADNFYPYCAGKLTIPSGSTPDPKFEGSFDMTENLMLKSSKNSNVKLEKIVSFRGYSTSFFTLDYLYFDGNVSCISGAGDIGFINVVDPTGTIRTIARVLYRDGLDTLPTIADLNNTLKSADGSNIIGLPATFSAYTATRTEKNILGLTYRNQVGPGHSRRMQYNSAVSVMGIDQGFINVLPDSEITSDTFSDYRAIPVDDIESFYKSEMRIENKALLPYLQAIGGPALSGAAMTIEDTTYTSPIPSTFASISYPAAATQQTGYNPIKKNVGISPFDDTFSLEVKILGESVVSTSPYWGTGTNAYGVKVAPITDIGNLALPIIGVGGSYQATSWTHARNHRTGMLHRVWQSQAVTTQNFSPYLTSSVIPFPTCLRKDQNENLSTVEWKNPSDHTEGIKFSGCPFLLYTAESSIATFPLARPTKPTMRDFGWKVGDNLTLLSQGKTHRDTTRVLPVVCAPTNFIFTGNSNSIGYFADLPVDRVYFRFFYSDTSTANIKIDKMNDAQGTGEFDFSSITSLYDSGTLVASDFPANTWNFIDLPTPISAKQTIRVTTTGNSNLQGVYIFSRKTGYYQLVRSDDGVTIFGGRIHTAANTHI